MADRGEPDETTVVRTRGGAINVWVFSGKLERTITERYTRRVEEFADDTRELTGLTDDEIGERVASREELGDLIGVAGQKAGATADAEFRRALARLIAGGLLDDAMVDEISYLTSYVVQMQPFDLRVLHAYSALESALIDTAFPNPRPVAIRQVSQRIDATYDLAELSTERLTGLGFLEPDLVIDGGTVGEEDEAEARCLVTSMGRRLLRLCEPGSMGPDARH